MWFKKKKKEEESKKAGEEPEDEEDDSEEEKPEAAADESLSNKIEMMAADITRLKGAVESFKEIRTSTSERFSTINEQIGELRGMVNDTQRSVGMIEVKATKAADLVESVHPDKLMIQVQKEDGKIEGLRGILEAKEEMMRNIMDQLKKLRDQVNLFRGVEQVIKLNEEVKDELMNVKKIVAAVERHADRVDNVFIEAQKSFEAFNTFADKLDSLKSELKELTGKVDKQEVAQGAFLKRADFEARIEKIEKHDTRVKKVLKEVEEYYKKLDSKFKGLGGTLKGQFDATIKKAEIMSNAFEGLLKDNPLLAEGLDLSRYIQKQLKNTDSREAAAAAAASAEVKSEEEADDKKEDKKEEKNEEKK